MITTDREIRIDHAKQDQSDQWHESSGKQKDPEPHQEKACEKQWAASLLTDVEMPQSRYDGERGGATGVGRFFQRIHVAERVYPALRRHLCFQRGQHFIDVARNFDLAKQRLDASCSIDDKRAPFNAPIFSAIHALFFIDAIGLTRGRVFVA